MTHSHWEPGLLERIFVNQPPAPICDMATKKLCDERFTTYLHGHLGKPCVKQIQPSKSKRGKMNTLATCVLANTD